MRHDADAFYESWPAAMNAVKARAPDIGRAFGACFQGLMKDSGPDGLSRKHKELIALGIGVAVRCEACIYSHVEKCLDAGAAPSEIMDATGVAVMMGGGPAYTYASVVAAALDHFERAGAQPARA